MSRKLFLALPLAAALALMAAPALAHESQEFVIGGKNYAFVVGSLNEPVFVDDKTGVDLHVARHDEGKNGKEVVVPMTGLEKTLKVELIAGDKKRTLDLSPAYGDAGGYKASFFPTVATTLSYRFFGTIENNPVDLTFSCNPAGHTITPEEDTSVEVASGVTRTSKTGAFGCPMAKAEAGFPEPSQSLRDLSASATSAAPAEKEDHAMLPLIVGSLGVLLALIALGKRR